MEHQRPPSQKYPAGLAGVLNHPEEQRDSAYFSSTDASSKHTSAGSGVLSPPSSGVEPSPVDKTPSPPLPTAPQHQNTRPHLLPPPIASPAVSNGHMSVASMVSPTTATSADPRRYDRPQSLESAPNSAGYANGDHYPESMSRRESVNSLMNQGFNDMRLGNSPYASHNQSTSSFHASLQQHRNPRPGLDNLSMNRISNGYQPSAERTPEGLPKTMRIAPAITGPATSQIARAAEPTKGQAWAFPEEEIHRVQSAGAGSLIESRRSSIAESFASSQYTAESRLPPGQRRLEDGPAVDPYQRLSNASEYSTVHHHSLQHKHMSDLRNEEAGVHGTQPYSRTPELRMSHKLAERKRRTEMKELFDSLRELMPHERGNKASKWEILTKAISEHNRQSDLIRQLQAMNAAQQNEIDMLRGELDRLHGRPSHGRPVHGQPMHERPMHGHPPPSRPASDPYAQDQYGQPGEGELLPSLRTMKGLSGAAGPESMTGVQYDAPRTNGYRPPEPGRF